MTRLPEGGGIVLMPSVMSTHIDALPSFPTQGSQVPWLRPGLLGGVEAQPLASSREVVGPGLPKKSQLAPR